MGLRATFSRRPGPVLLVTALLALCGAVLAAQAQSGANSPGSHPAAQPAGSTAQGTHTPPHKKKLHAKAAPEPAPVVEVAPPPPDWPANAKAEPASVGWDGRDLSISAANSSLQQILRDISTATGVKVEGIDRDQRIFGSYGPAAARDVLGKLLEGSGYNVLMIGDRGEGTPRELVLTAKAGGGKAPQVNGQANQGNDEEAPEEPEQPEPPPQEPPHRPFGAPAQQPGENGRTPQQLLQEMQQRQLQQQQQQQQQQQGAPDGQTPGNQPPKE